MEDRENTKEQSGITVGYQCELMQNYVAESNIDFGKGLLTVKASQDYAYLFFIDKKAVLQVLVYSKETNSGWRTHRISPDGYEVTAFSINENLVKGCFRLSYARRKNEISELLVAENIAVGSIDNEKWELDYQWKFKKIERRERIIDHITMDEQGLLYSANFTRTDANFYYFKYADDPVPYTLPENGNRVEQIKLGRVSNNFGVFLLYYVANYKTLLFRALHEDKRGETSQYRYKTGADIQCFDLLLDETGNSVLYTAGKGIHRFTGKLREREEIVAPSSEFNFTKIDASQLKDEVSLWTLGKSASKSGLFYLTNRTYDSSSENPFVGKSWTKPLQMHADIEEFESIKGENLINQLYLFGKTKDSDREGLIHFWQDKVSTRWQEQFLNVDDLENTIEIESYTIQVKFSAENMENLSDKKIAVSSNENIAVYINNRRRFLLDGNAAEFDIVLGQNLNIIYPTKALQSGKIILSSDFLDDVIEIDPASGVMREIKAKLNSADSIKNAKTQTGNSLMSGDASGKDLEAAAKAIRQMVSASEYLEKPAEFRQVEIKNEELPVPLLGSNSIFSAAFNAVGDLYHAVERGFETITSYIVDISKKVCKIIIEIAGQILDFVVDTARKAVAFVERVFDKIKVFFKDLFDFLAFLFEWDDIIETKEVLKKIGEKYLDDIKGDVTDLKKAAVGYIMDLREKYDPKAKIFDGQNFPGGNFNSMMKQSAQPDSVDSRINWVDSRKDVIFGSSAKTNSGAVTLEQIGEIKNSNEAEDLPSEILDLFISLIKGDISFGNFLENLVNLVVPLALKIAQKIVETVFDLAIKFLEIVKQFLYSPIDIPLLSSIYKQISGSDLSIADFIALIISIPATIAYKLIHQKKMFGEVSGDAFIENLQFN